MPIGTLLDDVPVAIASVVNAAAITLDGETLTASDTDVRVVSPPHLVVAGPSAITRREPDEPESQLGSRDVGLSYALRLYVPLAGADAVATGQRAARRMLGAVIDVLDANPTMLGTVNLEAQFVDGEMSFTDENAAVQMVIYECELVALCLVS